MTLILFSEQGRVLAEIIGPEGCEDAIRIMPEAILQALKRTIDRDAIAVLDDEGLWRQEWGMLRSDKSRAALARHLSV
ncbi:hypothetical protein [Roseomonas elaeocarpi]|uniref:Uncharacterized protein n=1 Tax=Roseomonas elaeocarpi TaxID=907779 RepID=A0ABV6JRH9_9PROT